MIIIPGLLLAALLQSAPTVNKIEPPDWWLGHSMNPVRLLLRGSRMNDAQLLVPPGFTFSRLRTSASGTSLFVDLTISPQQRPGLYWLRLANSSGVTSIPFYVRQTLPAEPPAPLTSRDVVYLLMPDRFAGRHLNSGKPPRSYHGGDFDGITRHLPYLKELGVTALWMTPIYDNAGEAYHGYGAIDLYGVEAHFGSLAALQTLVAAAHHFGIKVVQDQVENHVGPRHPFVDDPPTPEWFHGTRAHHLKEDFHVWSLLDPTSSDALKRLVTDGWFADLLPDVNQDDEEARRYEIQNTLWWLGTAPFDAIRQDTWPYVPRDFWREWLTAIHRQFPSMTVVGETLDRDPPLVSSFENIAGNTVFDYPLFFALRDVFIKHAPLMTIPQLLSHDRLYAHPEALWTFLGNHDQERLANSPGASLATLQLAYTTLFSVRGVPGLYYGDELGMQGGDDPDNRRDFPPAAFSPQGRTAQQGALFSHIQKLIALRKTLPALSHGDTENLVVTDQQWIFLRHTAEQLVVVALNNAGRSASVVVPADYLAGKVHLHGLTSQIVQAEAGHAFVLPAHSGEIFEATR